MQYAAQFTRHVFVTVAALALSAFALPRFAVAEDESSEGQENENALQMHDLLRDNRVAVGLRITPVQLNFRGKNPALVGLGSYLVNAVGGCSDCHTHPNFVQGGNPFLGEPEVINAAEFLAGGRQFGPFTSANITPNNVGLPAGLTFNAFKTLLRTGRDPENSSRILQVMPWNVFRKMTDLDLRAIYEYLRAIPSLPNNPSPGP